MKNILGVLGGMGPMASALFYKMITEKTAAEKDQDHINIVLLSDASTPDRTAAMLSDDFAKWQAAWDSLHEDCRTLESLGCKAICCTCNTAHYYLHQCDDLGIPVISMIRETAKKMGAEDLMYLLACCTDHYSSTGFNPKIRFTRNTTLMEGGPCCDFCFYMEEDEKK